MVCSVVSQCESYVCVCGVASAIDNISYANVYKTFGFWCFFYSQDL